MIQLISLAIFISVIWYTISIRKRAKAGQAQDSLSMGEKVYVWVASLANPIFAGAVFYYGWKKLLPAKAKKANNISLWAFLIEIILWVLLVLVSSH